VTAIDALLARLPRVTLVLGKGGVGKTTVASGIAALFAARGEHTVIVTTDPAGTLADAVERPDARRAAAIPSPLREHLDLWVIDAASARAAFLDRWRETIATILDRGTYLDREDIDGMVDAALPGADEIFALLSLGELLDQKEGAYARIVIDTAPTGHTLRLLQLPATFAALIALLDRMQDKHRFMVRALTHRYRSDVVDRFLDEMRGRVERLRAVLTDTRAGAVLVTRDEPVVQAETMRYASALRETGIGIVATIFNSHDQSRPSAAERAVGGPTYTLPRVAPPVGVEAMAELLSLMRELADGPASVSLTEPFRKRSWATGGQSASFNPSQVAALARTLTIVAGKGGVGKTTVATAIAIACADQGRRTLLVSTDPAPSIADALDLPIGDEATPVPDVPALFARQMDATAAFARLRDEYRERIDAVFESLVARGLDAAQDRAIVRDLLSLAPAGIDEVYAMSVLADVIEENAYDFVIVDPAPTGHLLRLLDMPELALDWAHRLMRLVLKYKEVAPLAEAGEGLLQFSRLTRALDALLHDPARCAVIEVSLDEPLVRGETERLAAELTIRHLAVSAIIWNRSSTPPFPLNLPAVAQLRTPTAPVVGAEALREWISLWRPIA
jgi:arsenite-transporting ATPase